MAWKKIYQKFFYKKIQKFKKEYENDCIVETAYILVIVLASFANLTQARVAREDGASTEKMIP